MVWNASFKSHFRSPYNAWLADPSGHEYTKGGNMKAPPRNLICDWVKSSWDSISVETVKNSFMSCAITTATDGSDDDKIHCFKAGQPCEAGRSILKDENEKLTTISDAEDPFADSDYVEDEEETNNNEICIDEKFDDDDDESDDLFDELSEYDDCDVLQFDCLSEESDFLDSD